MSVKLGIVGLGKIAHDQHLPAIAGNADFQLAATVDPYSSGLAETPHFSTLADMLTADIAVDAVILCTPPQARATLALEAIAAGKGVMLEKPPATGLAQVLAMKKAARRAGASLFATWHSREAAGVAPARTWLRGRQIISASITWREDVRYWHPGQSWIWRAGGMGVFDPGINALSILTSVLPDPVVLDAARLEMPGNCEAPIAAQLTMHTAGSAPISADFDFRQQGEQTWKIEVATDAGKLVLDEGGASLILPGCAPVYGADEEYRGLYQRFARLLRKSDIDCDIAPLALVADAFMLGECVIVPDFVE